MIDCMLPLSTAGDQSLWTHVPLLQPSFIRCSHPALIHHYSYSPLGLTASVTGSESRLIWLFLPRGRGACTGSVWYVLVGGHQPLTIHTPSPACNSHWVWSSSEERYSSLPHIYCRGNSTCRALWPPKNPLAPCTRKAAPAPGLNENLQLDWKNLLGYIGRLKSWRMRGMSCWCTWRRVWNWLLLWGGNWGLIYLTTYKIRWSTSSSLSQLEVRYLDASMTKNTLLTPPNASAAPPRQPWVPSCRASKLTERTDVQLKWAHSWRWLCTTTSWRNVSCVPLYRGASVSSLSACREPLLLTLDFVLLVQKIDRTEKSPKFVRKTMKLSEYFLTVMSQSVWCM